MEDEKRSREITITSEPLIRWSELRGFENPSSLWKISENPRRESLGRISMKRICCRNAFLNSTRKKKRWWWRATEVGKLENSPKHTLEGGNGIRRCSWVMIWQMLFKLSIRERHGTTGGGGTSNGDWEDGNVWQDFPTRTWQGWNGIHPNLDSLDMQQLYFTLLYYKKKLFNFRV